MTEDFVIFAIENHVGRDINGDNTAGFEMFERGAQKTKIIVKVFNNIPVFCNTFDAQIRQASDIMVDGTQDPAKTCNGISIGLGFEMSELQFGNVANPVAPTPHICP